MISYLIQSANVVVLAVAGFIVSFTLSLGMGANDVANAFGTTYGAKIMTLLQILIVASIFELLGAILLGSKVLETLRTKIFNVSVINSKYSTSPDCIILSSAINVSLQNMTHGYLGCSEMTQLFGSVSSLMGASVWMLIANIVSLPVSTTHSIVGSLLGYALVALKGDGIEWLELGKIIGSWFISPLASGAISTFIYLFIYHTIIKKNSSEKIGLKLLPGFYFVTVFIIIFSVLYEGSSILHFDKLGIYTVLAISGTFGLCASLLVKFLQVPFLKKKFMQISSYLTTDILMIRQSDDQPKSPGTDDTIIVVDQERKTISQTNTQYIKEDDKISLMFRYMQIMVACYGSFAHGGNDVSNSIAPLMNIWLIMTNRAAQRPSNKDMWLLAYGAIAMVIGLSLWGKRVLKTVGKDITEIKPSMAFSIELGSVLTVVSLTWLGMPVSTTHCKIGSVIILGIVTNGRKSIKVKLILMILLSWFVTLPVSGAVSAICFFFIQGFYFRFF